MPSFFSTLFTRCFLSENQHPVMPGEVLTVRFQTEAAFREKASHTLLLVVPDLHGEEAT
jgi:hypothetical protein